MVKILINNQEFTDNLLSADFSIIHRVREYSGDFTLFVHKSLLPFLKPSVDIKVYLGEKLIYGGIIYEMSIDRVDADMFKVFITGGEYTVMASRRTISGILNTEPDPAPGTGHEDLEPLPGEDPEGLDRNTTGRLVERYLNKFLSEEGILKGEIVEGGNMAETDLDEWDTMSINDIYNTLADITGDDWHIGPDRKLYFGGTGYEGVDHTEPERELNEENVTREQGGGFFNLEVEYTLNNYKNKVFIVGGDPDEEISEDYLNFDGDLKYIKQLDTEINYMANLNNNSGVWGHVIREEKITNLENAESRATKELESNGKLPIEITVSTFMDCFEPTDTIFVNLESWDINNQIFSVEEVKIRTAGDKLIYTLKLVNKINVEVRGEDFFKFMEKLVKEAKKRTILKPLKESEGGSVPEFNLPSGWDNIPIEEILKNSVVFDPNSEYSMSKTDGQPALIGDEVDSINYFLNGSMGEYYSYHESIGISYERAKAIRPKVRDVNGRLALSFEHGKFIPEKSREALGYDRSNPYHQDVAELQRIYGSPQGGFSFAVIKDMSDKYDKNVYRGYGSEFPGFYSTDNTISNNKVGKKSQYSHGEHYIYDGKVYVGENIESVDKTNKPLSIIGGSRNGVLPNHIGGSGNPEFVCVEDWDGLYGCQERPRYSMGNNIAILYMITIPYSYMSELGPVLEGPERDGSGIDTEAYLSYKILYYLYERFGIESGLPVLDNPWHIGNWWGGYL